MVQRDTRAEALRVHGLVELRVSHRHGRFVVSCGKQCRKRAVGKPLWKVFSSSSSEVYCSPVVCLLSRLKPHLPCPGAPSAEAGLHCLWSCSPLQGPLYTTQDSAGLPSLPLQCALPSPPPMPVGVEEVLLGSPPGQGAVEDTAPSLQDAVTPGGGGII